MLGVAGRFILFTGRPVQFVAVDAFAMEDRSSVAAAQQLFADTRRGKNIQLPLADLLRQ